MCIEYKNCTRNCPHKTPHEENYNCTQGHCNGMRLPCRKYTIQELRKDKINNLKQIKL